MSSKRYKGFYTNKFNRLLEMAGGGQGRESSKEEGVEFYGGRGVGRREKQRGDIIKAKKRR